MTTRRALAALFAAHLALAPMAEAKILVVYDRFWENESQTAYGFPEQQGRMIQAVKDCLDHTGASYEMVPIQRMKTLWGGQSILPRNWNASGGTATDIEQFDGTMWLGWNGSAGNANAPKPNPSGFSGCYPCSLTMLVKAPTTPQMYVFGAAFGTTVSTLQFESNVTGLRCSTGVKAVGGTNATGLSALTQKGYEDTPFLSASNVPASSTLGSTGIAWTYHGTTPAGGRVRPIIKVHPSAMVFEDEYLVDHASNNADSAITGAGADTFTVFERQLSSLGTGKANLLFAHVMGASPCADSINVLPAIFSTPCEFDAPTFFAALARFDSLTGGGVWERDAKIPLLAGVTVEGFCTTSRRDTAGGGAQGDSSATKAMLAQAGDLGIPYTAAVNVDSLGTYPNHLTWAGLLGRVRYTPQAWTGVSDTTAASGNTSATRPVDVFGHYRTRAFVGDGSGVGADSSIAAQLKWKRSLLAAYVGANKLSGLCIAPLDDYSPRNWLWTKSAPESLIYAVKQGGFLALRTDVHTRWAQPGKIPAARRDLLLGYWTAQQTLNDRIGGDVLRLLGQTGGSISGGKYQADTTGATKGFGGYITTPTVPHMIVGRFWHGLVHDTFDDPDWWPRNGEGAEGLQYGKIKSFEDSYEPFRHASLLKLHLSDFSGLPNGPPAAPAFFALRSLKRQFDCINRLAGRQVFRFAYPEEIRP